MTVWKGRSVFLTGHTGFQGAWLTLLLQRLGAQIHGYALDPPTQPSLFDEAGLVDAMAGHTIGDVRDLDGLRKAVHSAQPSVVLHLAAQPLVRASYEDPTSTFATNVMGTVNLLEALRVNKDVEACVIYTSDKCYDNREWSFAYRENDNVGGHDPYSASKGAAEIATWSYVRSFFKGRFPVASVRAGNVLGGGDWAKDRLVPDAVRAFQSGQPLRLRSPQAIRPWQHVLDPLGACLAIVERQLGGDPGSVGPFNIGPLGPDHRTVGELAEEFRRHWPGSRLEVTASKGPHEAKLLRLDTAHANTALGWSPRWGFAQTVQATARWYLERAQDPDGFDARGRTLEDIRGFFGSGP